MAEDHLEYRSTNKDKIARQQKEWRESEYGQKNRKEYNKQYWLKNKQKESQRLKKYNQTESGRESYKIRNRRARIKFPDKIKARNAAQKITLEPCKYPDCNVLRVDKHHWDYLKPLEVVMLCRKHHNLADRVKRIIDNKV